LHETLEARVTERTGQLAASETRFRALIEHAPDMIALVRVDEDGDIVYEIANPAIAEIAGLTPAVMVGRSVASALPPEQRAILKARFTDCITTGRIQRYEMASDFGSGSRILDSILVPMPAAAPDAGRRLVLLSARDITAQRHTEDALRQSQKMEAVGQLTGGLAHDFNNLLAGITGSLDLISKRLGQGRTAEIGRFVEAAMGSAKRAAALTHRLLAFSRRQTLDPRPTDVARLTTAMEELIGRSMGPGITVETQMTEGLWTLCDPNQLESALLNLAINARDAMPDGGRLTISAANATLDDIAAAGVEPGAYVAISVADTGAGMSPEVMARVFEPFFTTKPLGQGTGLGLSMVYGFARQSGGHVRIESREGVGTVVRLYLPRHRGGDSTDAAPPTQAEDQIPAGAATVLVVDDEPVVRMLVCEVLFELGYVALEAHDGPEGLRILGTDARIDLLVTDVGLPGGVNGRQLADAAQVLRPELKVLFITGFAETAAIGDSQLAPGMEVVTKPFELAALAGRIRGMMEA
ncbi:MAG TPA: ATP-binding protein, partial [Acetobacteraceae bacterium]